MNRTKRKIFETSMKLFAEKGYDATSIEEITSVVGVAKGTLYYHFSSKEEIFNFLIDEGMKLLQNSIIIKTSQKKSCAEKIKSILLIQLKIMYKYEDFITIILSQMWGIEARNIQCQKYILKYIEIIEQIIQEGIDNNEIIPVDPKVISSEIFSMTGMSMLCRMKSNEEISIDDLYKQIEELILNGLLK